MKALSPVDIGLLQALGRYQLLTIGQADKLGLAKRWHIGDRFRLLKRFGFVKIEERPRMVGPRVHWLTPKGAQALTDLAEDAGEPVTVAARRLDYRSGPHLSQRVAIVDCHIALRQWAAAIGGEVVSFRTEFDPNPAKLAKALSFTSDRLGAPLTYEPDAVSVVVMPDGKAWLFALEMETGGQARRLDNFAAKLPDRLRAFEARAVELGMAWPKERALGRLLFVFADEAMFEAAKRFAGTGDAWKRVFFASLPGLMDDFGGAWWQPGRRSVSPFQSLTE